MRKIRPDYLTRFRPDGDAPLAKTPISVKLPVDVDLAVRSLPNQSEWLRRVICDAAARDLSELPKKQ
jgi:hypothetical protein